MRFHTLVVAVFLPLLGCNSVVGGDASPIKRFAGLPANTAQPLCGEVTCAQGNQLPTYFYFSEGNCDGKVSTTTPSNSGLYGTVSRTVTYRSRMDASGLNYPWSCESVPETTESGHYYRYYGMPDQPCHEIDCRPAGIHASYFTEDNCTGTEIAANGEPGMGPEWATEWTWDYSGRIGYVWNTWTARSKKDRYGVCTNEVSSRVAQQVYRTNQPALTASIIGRSSIKPNSDCMWQAVVSGGRAPLTIVWIGGTVTGSTSTPVVGQFAASGQLKLRVTDYNNHVVETIKSITVSSGAPLCPI